MTITASELQKILKASENSDINNVSEPLLERITQRINQHFQQSGWVDANERLPEDGSLVLTYGSVEGYRLISAGSINTVGNGLPTGVRFWQPIQPPEESEDES